MHLVTVALAILIAFLWGVMPVCHKYVLKSHDPLALIIVGSAVYAVCTFVLLAVQWRRIKKDLVTWRWRTVALLGGVTVVSAFLANLLYMYILQKNESHIVIALVCTSPAFTYLLAMALLGERPTAMSTLGVVLITAGIVCVGMQRGAPVVEPME